MYPSIKDPVYGTFVQSFVENMSELNKDGITNMVVLKGRDGRLCQKIWKYIVFYVTTLFTLLFSKYDIIYVHTITYPIIPIRIASLFKDLPLVFNVHGGDVLTRGKTATKLKEIAKSLLKKAKLIVSPSYYFKDILLREFPFLKEEKIYVSPSGGIDRSFFRDEKRIENETFTIGYVSRIDVDKGWDTFIRSLTILKERNIIFKAIIVGRGAETGNMLEMISSLSLDQYVQYIGPVPYKELPNIYSSFDLFIFPTCLEESLGLVGLEAMACGIPVVGSKIGGLQDYIVYGFNGYYFTSGNEVELSDRIEEYLKQSSELKRNFQNNARNTSLKYKSEIINKELFDKILSL